MRLGIVLFLVYALIFALCFSYPISRIAGDLRTRYLEGVEEPLVDQANILAGIVGREMEEGRFDPDGLYEAFRGIHERRLSARIYDLSKERVDVRVYITDREGVVIFDSSDPATLGEDYSEWRDVRLTLQGEYGARTTRLDPEDPASSILYVAAPVLVRGELAGVLTVAEPTSSVNAFIDSAKAEIFRIGALSGLVAIGLSLLVSLWVSSQIQRLINYANEVREGRRVSLPHLARTELRQMGQAFDKMRESLEGKKYVEQYVQTLTHEIKSPVSAISGAAEILEEDMPRESRVRFLANIRTETVRIQDLVERMLKLSELESRRTLQAVEAVPVAVLARTVLESKETVISRKGLAVETSLEEGASVMGDSFLLEQAVSNLLQNAIDFSPEGGRVMVRTIVSGAMVRLEVEDEGPGIPDYANERVFEKFFSLQRPDTGKKSTGLGLTLVREVAALHGGEIGLLNRPAGGFRATLSLPLSRPSGPRASRRPRSAGEPSLR